MTFSVEPCTILLPNGTHGSSLTISVILLTFCSVDNVETIPVILPNAPEKLEDVKIPVDGLYVNEPVSSNNPLFSS